MNRQDAKGAKKTLGTAKTPRMPREIIEKASGFYLDPPWRSWRLGGSKLFLGALGVLAVQIQLYARRDQA